MVLFEEKVGFYKKRLADLLLEPSIFEYKT